MSMDKCPKCGERVNFNDFFCQTCGTALTSPKRPRTKQFMSYVQIIGIVEIVLGIFSAFLGVLFAFLAYIFPRLIELDEIQLEDISEPVAQELLNFISIFMIFLVVVFFLYAIAAVWFGIRLLQYKNSGRIGTMVLGALSLINIPLGTIFGLAALYILTKPEAEALFE